MYVSHLARTRHPHQVTIITLQRLQQELHLQSKATNLYLAWKDDVCNSSPTFVYWDFILRYEMLIFIFIAANREQRNFSAVNALFTFEDVETKQYQEFVKCVLEECSISIHDLIKKNSVAVFKLSHKNIKAG